MGFMDSLFDKNVANSTKCSTWKQVTESHMIRNQDVGIRLKDLGGMLILLAIGLSAALFLFVSEKMMGWCKSLFDGVAISFNSKHIPFHVLQSFAGKGTRTCYMDHGVQELEMPNNSLRQHTYM